LRQKTSQALAIPAGDVRDEAVADVF